MKMKIETITPSLATKLLEGNEKNRYIRKTTVEHYAEAMRNGEWKLTPDAPITIGESGRLLNGQHRLSAIILSGASCEFVVWRDVPENTFDVIDTGVKRTGGDALQIAGLKNKAYKEAAAIARAVIMYIETNNSRWLSGGSGGAKSSRCNNNDLVEFLKTNNDSLSDATYRAQHWYRLFKGVTVTSTGAMCMLLPAKLQPKFNEFMDRLCDGYGLPMDSPIYQLRQSIFAEVKSVDRLQRFAMFLRCWEMYATNKPCKRLMKTYDEFPKLYSK